MLKHIHIHHIKREMPLDIILAEHAGLVIFFSITGFPLRVGKSQHWNMSRESQQRKLEEGKEYK